jgi:hypothetical protein
MKDTCGAPTNDGGTCSFAAKYPDGKCGHHTTSEEKADSKEKQSKLETNPELIDLIREEMTRGATIAEALAEVEQKTGLILPRSTHDTWMQKGRQEDGKDIYIKYRSMVNRARQRGKKTDRNSIKQTAQEKGDVRTWLEVHKMQFGKLYNDEETAETQEVPFAIPEELIDEWRQQATPQ